MKQHAPNYYACVRVVNTDKRMLEWIVDTFEVGGVTVNGRNNAPRWKYLYKWRAGGRKNLPFILEGVMPYLVIKKDQAELALELATRPAKERQLEIYLTLQELKRAHGTIQGLDSSMARVR